jgi:branched-chain amino acid transport system substrate-binding protein
LDGLRLGFRSGMEERDPDRADLLVESVGDGPLSTVASSSRLLQRAELDLVVGVVNATAVASARRVFEASDKVFIAAEIGANAAPASEGSSHVFHNTMRYWQSAHALGIWAATHLGSHGFLAASLYDSGYDSFHAFRLGYEQAGGVLSGSALVDGQPNLTVTAACDRIRSCGPSFVAAFFSTRSAVDFVRRFAESGLTGQIPLVGPGFLTDEALLPEMGDAACGIRTVLPWSRALGEPENLAFLEAYRAVTGRDADSFAVLGYDTARLVSQALDAAGGSRRTDRLIAALERTRFASPRGTAMMNPITRVVEAPLYLREVRRGRFGYENAILGALSDETASVAGAPALAATDRSRWTNAYLSC